MNRRNRREGTKEAKMRKEHCKVFSDFEAVNAHSDMLMVHALSK